MAYGFGRAVSRPIAFRLYPSGEFSATKVKECSSLDSGKSLDSFEEDMRRSDSSYARGEVSDELRASMIASSLGSSNVPNYHKPRKVRGRKGMTRYNKRLVVNSAILLQQKYGRNRLSFLTLTLPPECASREASSYAEAKRQMLQWLARRLDSENLPKTVIGCTELQSSRYANSGAFALHEHWVFVGRRAYSPWSLTPSVIQCQWLEILSNVYRVDIQPENRTAASRVERITKSVSAYLGKYMSKGEKLVDQVIQDGNSEFLPSSWVTKTTEMLRLFQASILRINGLKGREIMELLQTNASTFCRYSRDLKIEIEAGFEIWIAFIGYLNSEGWRLIKAFTC